MSYFGIPASLLVYMSPLASLYLMYRRARARQASGVTMAGWESIVWIAPGGPQHFGAVED